MKDQIERYILRQAIVFGKGPEDIQTKVLNKFQQNWNLAKIKRTIKRGTENYVSSIEKDKRHLLAATSMVFDTLIENAMEAVCSEDDNGNSFFNPQAANIALAANNAKVELHGLKAATKSDVNVTVTSWHQHAADIQSALARQQNQSKIDEIKRELLPETITEFDDDDVFEAELDDDI